MQKSPGDVFRDDFLQFSLTKPSQVLGRSLQIFAPGRAFTVGLSGSADEDYFDESDFTGIVESIRIGI